MNRARELRKNLTDAELKLWGQLRNRHTYGEKFRRQQPIGKYIVDFVCWRRRSWLWKWTAATSENESAT